MQDKLNGSVCLNHPDTPAVARCAVCRKPICADCVKESGGVKYCSKDCYDKAIRTGAMAENVLENKKKVVKSRNYKNAIVFVIVVALAAGGFFYYRQHKAKIDRKIKNAKYEMEQKVQEGKRAVDKNLIKESKYKRTREMLVQ